MSKTEDFVKNALSEKSLETFGKDWKELNKKQQSDNLASYFVESVMPEIGYPDASELFDYGYTDGGNELEIDLLIKTGGDCHFIQSKFRGFNSNLDRGEIEKFQQVLIRLANKDFDKHQNKRLVELLQEVDWKNDNLHFWFVTNLQIKNQAEASKSNEIHLPEDFVKNYKLGHDRVTYHYIDQQFIYDQMSFINTKEEQLGVDEVEIHSSKNPKTGRSPIIEVVEENYLSAIMVIDSEQIARICRQHKIKLFDFNIRNYIGESRKNKKILSTAKEEPDNFFLFNNGVSAICEDYTINKDGDSITASKFSVINGAQTVRILSLLEGQAKYPKVMLRITAIPHHKDRNNFLREVVRFNNTQNEIKTSDFRSNDLIQKSFTDNFFQLKKDGKPCIYQSKRIHSTQKNVIKIDMTDFARAFFNYKKNPYELVGSGAVILFDFNIPNSQNPYYHEIFGKENEFVTKEDFEYKAGVYFVSKFAESWLSKEKKRLRELDDDDSKLTLDAIERKNIFIWLLNELLCRLQNETNLFNESNFMMKVTRSKDSLTLDDDKSKNSIFLIDAFSTLRNHITYEYIRLKEDGMTNRQWVRGSEKVIKTLRESVARSPNLTASLMNKLP